MRVFLDANVLFTAAHNPMGKASLLIQLGQRRGIELVTCELAVVEARRNIQRKFPEGAARLDALLQRMETTVTAVDGTCPVDLARKDQPILLSAIAARATHLLTGDLRHFGRYMDRPHATGGVIIQTVAAFLSRL